MNKIIYVGWISAYPWQKRRLRKLGVAGNMIYNWKMSCFEYCVASKEGIENLIQRFPKFWPGSFTALNPFTNKQYPRYMQIYWRG